MMCKICKKVVDSYYIGEVCSEECYTKKFWTDIINNTPEEKRVVVKGNHYIIGNENAITKGFDGYPYTIQFNDGRVVKTTNLWNQGIIPEDFRNILKDNAKFI